MTCGTTEIAPRPSGAEEVHVAVIDGHHNDGHELFHAPDGAFETAFHGPRPQWSWTGTTTADLLAHSDQDLWFEQP